MSRILLRTTIILILSALATISTASSRPNVTNSPTAKISLQEILAHRLYSNNEDKTLSKDSLSPSTAPTTDSIDLRFARPFANVDSVATDSTTKDSTKSKSSGLDAPVEYTAADSLVFDANAGLAFLYGKANVKYEDMQLDAATITMNMDSSLVHAEGLRDSTGKMTDAPIYKQGGDNYDSEKMSFNFKTKKGYISNVATVQGNGFLQSSQSKRADDGMLYMQHAKYTTCDAKHPHFYMQLSRAKVKPGKEAIFGPAYLVVEDVPLPLAIPYGFFPFNKSYCSGFIMPTYGDETSRGFYLRDGGYYFAINDKMDFKALGEIYTKGSWGLSGEMNYNKRYKYSGNFYVSYLRTVEGEKNMPDYAVTKSLKLQWSHRKDSKANPNSSFSARINFASENYEKKNLESMYNPLSYSQSTRASSVSYSYTFPSIGLNISSSANLTQSLRDSSIAVTLPDLSITLNRFYPFRRKRQVGKERWYEKISMSYSGQMSNSITTRESELFKSNLIKDWRNGMQHTIPIDATFQLFKYINISPNFRFHDIMYSKRVERSWDTGKQQEVNDTTYGFYNLYDWQVGVSANTTLYGFYKPLKQLFGDKIVAIRHVLKPSVSFSYAPDFTTDRYGYVDHYVKTDQYGNVSTVEYSPYAGQLYGYPSGKQQGMVSMSLSNNLEMKIRSDRDTTGMRKISLIDELSGSLSYNFAAPTRPWSDLNTRLRLKLTKSYTFSMSARFATYAYKFDENGRVVNSDRTEWSYGRFGRFQGMSQNLSYTFNNGTFRKWMDLFTGKSKDDDSKLDNDSDNENEDMDDANVDPEIKKSKKGSKKKEKAQVDEDGYMAFKLPWAFTVSYGVSMFEDKSKEINVRRMRYPFSFNHTLNFSGFLRIADGWNITFSSGYDFNYHKLSMTTASVSRDLHCFEMSCNVVLRPYSSFNFSFRAKANELADALKWDKRSSYSSNIEWY